MRMGKLGFLFLFLAFMGCGTPIPNVAGPWVFTGTSTATNTQTFSGAGTLVQSRGGYVTGAIGHNFALAGTVDWQKAVNFTIAGACSPTASIQIAITGTVDSSATTMSGSYVESDECAVDSGAWTATKQ